jgi:branched-subunit amino acid aminotransferase/4-amino-4-deoxychorismate lyase
MRTRWRTRAAAFRALEHAREHAEPLAAERGACQLWVQHSDRLARGDARTAMHLVEYVLWAIKIGVTFRSVQDNDNVRDLLYAAVGGQRNFEDSKRKSAAVTWGERRQFERGERLGGPVPDGAAASCPLASADRLTPATSPIPAGPP